MGPSPPCAHAITGHAFIYLFSAKLMQSGNWLITLLMQKMSKSHMPLKRPIINQPHWRRSSVWLAVHLGRPVARMTSEPAEAPRGKHVKETQLASSFSQTYDRRANNDHGGRHRSLHLFLLGKTYRNTKRKKKKEKRKKKKIRTCGLRAH